MKLAVSCLFIQKINISIKLFARHSMPISTDFMLHLRQNKKLSLVCFSINYCFIIIYLQTIKWQKNLLLVKHMYILYILLIKRKLASENSCLWNLNLQCLLFSLLQRTMYWPDNDKLPLDQLVQCQVLKLLGHLAPAFPTISCPWDSYHLSMNQNA